MKNAKDGVWSIKELQYGDFMLVTRRTNPPPPKPHPFGPRDRGGRSARGPATFQPCKRSSEEATLDDNSEDLEDSAASPMKTKPMEAEEEVRDPTIVKKNINFDEVKPSSSAGTTATDPDTSLVPPPPLAYMNPRDRAKQWKTCSTNDLATSAASGAEDRRAQ
jgi:hypothetical protein